MNFQEYLESLSACPAARQWAGERTAEQAWDQCERADWLLWWAALAGAEKKDLVRIACQIARTALPCLKKSELRPLKAIETAEAWCEGKATPEDVRAAAASAASAAAYAADYAAYAAAYAAAARHSKKWSETQTAKLQEFAALVREAIQFPGMTRRSA